MDLKLKCKVGSIEFEAEGSSAFEVKNQVNNFLNSLDKLFEMSCRLYELAYPPEYAELDSADTSESEEDEVYEADESDDCPMYIEKRTRRVQLLLQPSLYKQIKKIATANDSSVNDVIHRILENALEKKNSEAKQ